MEVEFDDDDLRELVENPKATAGHGDAVDRGYRKVMQAIWSAVDERDLHASRGRNFEKLKGDRAGQYSLRINDQWRLIVEIRQDEQGKRIGVVEIADYH